MKKDTFLKKINYFCKIKIEYLQEKEFREKNTEKDNYYSWDNCIKKKIGNVTKQNYRK